MFQNSLDRHQDCIFFEKSVSQYVYTESRGCSLHYRPIDAAVTMLEKYTKQKTLGLARQLLEGKHNIVGKRHMQVKEVG